MFFLVLTIFAHGCFPLPYAKAMQSIQPTAAVVGIFCFALLFSIPGAWHLRRKFNFRLKNIAIITAVALLGTLANYSICQAIMGSSATIFNVISRAEIIIAMILGWVYLHEHVGLRVWIAVAVVLSGILLMRGDTLTFNLSDWETVLWALCTAGCFAAVQVLSKLIIHEVDPQVPMCSDRAWLFGLADLPGKVEVSMLTLRLDLAGNGSLFWAVLDGLPTLIPFVIYDCYNDRDHLLVPCRFFEFLIFGRILSTLN